jgi:hypothetical protein
MDAHMDLGTPLRGVWVGRVMHDCTDAGVRATQETKPRSNYRAVADKLYPQI